MKRTAPIFAAFLLFLSPAAGCGCGDRQESETGYREDVPPAQAAETAIEELGEGYWPNLDLTQEALENQFGIGPDLYEEFFGQVPMISVNVDTLLIVKAAEGQEEAVQERLNRYREESVGQSLQYPMNLEKVQASRVVSFGRYVCFVQLGGDTSALEEEIADGEQAQAAVFEHCQAENDRALAKIEETLSY